MTASRLLYIAVILGAVPFLLSFRVPEAKALGLAYDLALLILVVIDYFCTQRPQLVTGTRDVPDRLSIGRANTVTLQISNLGGQKLDCRVKDDYPAQLQCDTAGFKMMLPPASKITLQYVLVPGKRGAYCFGDIYVRYLSRLRLFWRQSRIASATEVKVFSDLKSLQELSIRLSRSTELGELCRRRRGQGTDFASLREYASGDDARSIDWKATARRGKPVLKTYEAQQEQILLILVDAGRLMVSELNGLTRFDHALNAALSLALAGLYRNDQVGIGIFAEKPLLYLPPRRGKGRLKIFLEAVYDTSPKLVEPDYIGNLCYFASAQKTRSLMVVLTDLSDPSGSQALLAGLASLSPRHLPFCVTLKDPQVDRLASSPAADLPGIYRKAVATDIQAQRELSLSVLTRRGCLVLDCPPQELSEKLVDRYIDIKTRGRL